VKSKGSSADLDSKDVAILKALRRNGRLSFAELGRLVGLSGPAAAERVARLTDDGVIKGFSARIDYAALGRGLSAVIEFAPNSGDYGQLQAVLSASAAVETVYIVTGEAFAVLIVHVGSAADLHDFLIRLHRYGRTRTSTILDVLEGEQLP
jgi:Lrp/AsnC family leucine-responsive transcriptional regulator